MKSKFVIATYQVAEQNQKEFISLMNEAEVIMRENKLMTSKPIYRMQSIINHRIQVLIYLQAKKTYR